MSEYNRLTCAFCDQGNHIVITTAKGNKIIPYYVYEAFVNMSPAERCAKLKSKNLCITCIYPGAVNGEKHKCFFLNFCCPHPSDEDGEKLHVLLCEVHKRQGENLKLLEKFKNKFITNYRAPLPQFSRHISCFSETVAISRVNSQSSNVSNDFSMEPEIKESAIFQLQIINIDGIELNLFFHSGCGDIIVKKSALDKLICVGRGKQVIHGPIVITGVGEQKNCLRTGFTVFVYHYTMAEMPC